MTTWRIFFATMLSGMLAIQSATVCAQSKAHGAILPQNEELRVAPSAVEDICRLPLSEAGLVRGCPKSTAPQMSGAWMLIFTPTSEVAPPFSSLATFSSDGVVINTSAGATFDPPNPPDVTPLPGSASPGVGAWVTRNYEVMVTIAHLLYDSSGQHTGAAKVRASLRIYREATDSFSGRYVTEIFNSAGVSIKTLNGTVVGQRIFVEQFPSNE